MLISGYSDCGRSILAERAEGEIYAQTERQLTAVLDRNWVSKGEMLTTDQKYSLIIGKKRINFYKDSGIPLSECDRIYTQRTVVLPGGWELPISVITETVITYRTESAVLSQQDGQLLLSDFASDYLKDQMIAGHIMTEATTISPEDSVLWLEGKYYCHEMIGQSKEEEIISPYGKSD